MRAQLFFIPEETLHLSGSVYHFALPLDRKKKTITLQMFEHNFFLSFAELSRCGRFGHYPHVPLPTRHRDWPLANGSDN